MKNVLVVFESRYGQAQKVAEFARELASRRGIEARLLRAGAAQVDDVTQHDAVVVVAPTYFGRHPKSIGRFLSDHADVLASRPLAFVAVSNSAASSVAGVRDEVVEVAKAFVTRHGVRPERIVTVGGALAYPRYGVLVRTMMRLIARRAGAPTDTSRVHELTDWASLEPVLEQFFEDAGLGPTASVLPFRPISTNQRSGIRARVAATVANQTYGDARLNRT